MVEIIVNINDENKRIDNFLSKYFEVSKPIVFKWIRTNKVKVNNKKVKHDYRLQLYDEIKVFINIEKNNDQDPWFIDSKIKLEILFEDENIILINKPVLIPSQNDNHQKDSIQKALIKYLYDSNHYDVENENNFIPSICNRLDTNTCGIIIGAKNAKALQAMNLLLKNHEIIKKYKCLVIGNIEPEKNTLIHYHYKDQNKNLVYISDEHKKGYKQIITKYRKEKFYGKYSLLDVELITGRTHQIRAHFNHIGYPLVGETKYKTKHTNIDKRFKYQALVSYYLEFKINDKQNYLYYLNNKVFKLNKFWFIDLLNN